MLGYGKYSLHFEWLCVQLKFRGINTSEEWKRGNSGQRAFFTKIDNFISFMTLKWVTVCTLRALLRFFKLIGAHNQKHLGYQFKTRVRRQVAFLAQAS